MACHKSDIYLTFFRINMSSYEEKMVGYLYTEIHSKPKIYLSFRKNLNVLLIVFKLVIFSANLSFKMLSFLNLIHLFTLYISKSFIYFNSFLNHLYCNSFPFMLFTLVCHFIALINFSCKSNLKTFFQPISPLKLESNS